MSCHQAVNSKSVRRQPEMHHLYAINIWISAKIKASCTVTENLLLDPPHDDSHITNKAQKKINDALFEFLASVDRRL